METPVHPGHRQVPGNFCWASNLALPLPEWSGHFSSRTMTLMLVKVSDYQFIKIYRPLDVVTYLSEGELR